MKDDKKVFEKLKEELTKSLERMGAENVDYTYITDTGIIVSFEYETKKWSLMVGLIER